VPWAAGRWVVEEHREPPADFHARPLPVPMGPTVWVCEPTVPTLVLGSGQHDEVADAAACAAAGVAVARRRTGGGAVLVEPGGLLWLDVLLPAGDPLWDEDVARAFLWLGEAWAAALGALGVDALVHRGGLCTTPWSRLVCFGGLGTGEVTDAGGVKLVGLSQRRSREGARFQCAALAGWDPARVVGLLALEPGERERAASALSGAARGVPVDLGALRAAVVEQLSLR
jgi:lipoate-protein ligase A